MSENNLKLDENEVHYVYQDQEYVLGDEEISPEIEQLICGDGSRAILVDGQYIVTDNQTTLLQDSDSNLTQYYINDNSESFIVDGEDNSVNSLFDNTECVQLIEEDANGAQQIIYYTNDDSNNGEFTPVQELVEGEDIEGIQDEEGNIYPFKRIKLEVQMLNFEEFVQQQADLTQEAQDDSSMEYTVLEDENNIQCVSYDEDSSQTGENVEKTKQIADLSKITGRNLITGQTVTLHNYMEKLKRRLNKPNNAQVTKKSPKKLYEDATLKTKSSDEEPKKPDLCDLLDKKISIGKTKSGKKIVGKIIHVGKKNEEKTNEDELVVDNEDVSSEDVEENEEEAVRNDEIIVRKSTMSVESFDQISKTLGGVMQMESVRKKLGNKNIVVKLVEKRYNSESESYIKTTSYSYGYMEEEVGCVNDEVVEKWKFVPDQDTQDILFRVDEKDGSLGMKTAQFPITTSLTILITHERNGTKTVRVNLNPAPSNLCTLCAQYFKTNLQLRQHMQSIHANCETVETKSEISPKIQEPDQVFGKPFICDKCDKIFGSQNKLQKHLKAHDVTHRPLKCLVCGARSVNKCAWKKHRLTYAGTRPYSCDVCSREFATQCDATFHRKTHFPEKMFSCSICLRTFSRHSNLLRHSEIHKGTGALYKCEICYCSYNYISSLTRHMVQNHMESGDFQKKNE